MTSPRPIKPSALPELESSAHRAWQEGFFQALPVGLVLGFAAAVVLLPLIKRL